MAMISYAHNHEDVMLNRVFRDVSDGFYIDVGAWHPVVGSVTMHFYAKGWSGINIEPAGHAYSLLSTHRPRDINLQVALGETPGVVELYETVGLGLSTVDEQLGRKYLETYQNVLKVPVRVTTLAAICEEHLRRDIDFMKIDTEGWELPVIRGGDWRRFRPRVVLVEAIVPQDLTPAWEAWDPFLIDQDYEFVYFDGVNRFYVRCEDSHLCRHFTVPLNVLDEFTTNEMNEIRQQYEECRAALEECLVREHESIGAHGRWWSFAVPLLRRSLQRTVQVMGVHKIIDLARAEMDDPGYAGRSKSARWAINSLRRAWSTMRRVIPPAARLRMRLWLLGLPAAEGRRNVPSKRRSQMLRQAEFGINVIGYISGEFGLGEAARGTARAALASDIPIALVEVHAGSTDRRREETPGEISSQPRYPVNLIQINPPDMLLQAHVHPFLDQSKAYNIGVWFWETSDLPDQWLEAFQYLDEIWAPSTYCLDVFARKSPIPVVRIPVCVEPVPPDNLSREALGVPEKGFLFLSVADFFSSAERKNPLGAVEAFHRAFGLTNEQAYLVLKLNNTASRPDILENLNQSCKTDSRVILIDECMDRGKLNALINQCDCLISLHRSEGFGLPIAEAMYMGKPAIATGWSANMDFMTIDNSLPVRYQLIPVNQASGPYAGNNGVWADPDLDHAAVQMKRVVSDPSLARTLGQAAKRKIREDFSGSTVGRLMRERLSFIRNHVW